MAFSFGSSQPAFGSTAPKPTGFGTAFGTTTSTTTTGFGGFGSGFGQTNAQLPAFGSTFGTPATGTTAPTFGSSFGTPVSSAAPFGSSFGGTTSAPAFGSTFGAPQQSTSLFGSTTKPSLFGASTSTPSLFSTPATATTGLFGTTTSQAPSLFGAAATTSTPSLFGSSTAQPSLFGQPATTSAPSLFGAAPGNTGFGGTQTTGFGGAQTTGFGATQGFGTGLFGSTSTAPSLFGSTFGTQATAPTGFGGFGTTTTGFGGFGSNTSSNLFGSTFGAKPNAPGPGVPSSISKNQAVVASVYSINVFNDERDETLKKWNMLQASWGTGKGYYNSSQPPIEYNPQNPYYKFKAMGYNMIPEHDNSDGIVKLVFSKKIEELRNQQDYIKNGIAGILGNKPNLSVEIVQIKAISENQTEIKITVSEKNVTGNSRKIPAIDLATYLNQPAQKQQLLNVGVNTIGPVVTPSKAELEEYLKEPPPGIDKQMWEAAIQDNPDPKKYVPVPINGFSDLKSRMLQQEYQTGLHQAFLEKVNKDITDLKTKHSTSIAQITELKQKFLELQHRILRVLVKQESTRKVGIAIQPEEELLRGRLEIMHSQLNNPKQFKGQVNELLANVKMMEGTQKQNSQQYRVDADSQHEIKQLLKMQQGGISQLINIIHTDLQTLNIISEGMKQILQNSNTCS